MAIYDKTYCVSNNCKVISQCGRHFSNNFSNNIEFNNVKMISQAIFGDRKCEYFYKNKKIKNI